jgi:hypothetical protein
MNSNFLRVISKTNDECKVCSSESRLFDVVDFHGNMDLDPAYKYRKDIFPLTGIPIYFWKCSGCGLLYTRAFDGFGPRDLKEVIYNQAWQDHFLGDPAPRAQRFAEILSQLFRSTKGISGLDYGGGESFLSAALRDRGYAFESYDPFFGHSPKPLEKFNLVTCIEVFEHVAHVDALVHDLDQLCSADAGVLFTTYAADRVGCCQGWAYCVPRSGHITFFSQKSLELLFAKINFRYNFLGVIQGFSCHFAWRGTLPYLQGRQTQT